MWTPARSALCACKCRARHCLRIEPEPVAQLPRRAGVDVPELGGLDDRADFQEILGVGEAALLHRTAVLAVVLAGAIDGHVQDDGRAVADGPLHVDAAQIVLRVRDQGVDVELQILAGAVLGIEHAADTVAIALLVNMASRTRQQSVVDLGDRQARVVCEQDRLVDDLAGDVTADLRARHAGQRLGTIDVGELADVFGRHGIDEAHRACRTAA